MSDLAVCFPRLNPTLEMGGKTFCFGALEKTVLGGTGEKGVLSIDRERRVTNFIKLAQISPTPQPSIDILPSTHFSAHLFPFHHPKLLPEARKSVNLSVCLLVSFIASISSGSFKVGFVFLRQQRHHSMLTHFMKLCCPNSLLVCGGSVLQGPA